MEIKENVPLHDKNWFGTGGAARFFAQPQTAQEFADALEFAYTNKLEHCILGHGANVLISDAGFDGLIIQPDISTISFNNSLVTAGSGVGVPELITSTLNHNLIGFEDFSGIPGTVGGAVFINLHYFERLIGNDLIWATIIEKSSRNILIVDQSWFNFGYNTTTLHAKEHYLIDATFKLKPATDLETSFARGRAFEIIRHRNSRYPKARTCGSFFRNFLPEELDKKNTIPAVGLYLEKIGAKNLRVRSAGVSPRHNNMIVTDTTNAQSRDIIELAIMMQRMVFEAFGLLPQTECQFIGFNEKPL